MNKDIEIKVCPFCGTKLEEKKENDGWVWYEHENVAVVCIIATLCVFPDQIDLWNRRV